MSEMPPVAVLAGGRAERMRPLTDQMPKAMLEVAGEPFIAHQLRLLRRQGVSRVVLCVGYLWEQIADFVGDGDQFGLSVIFAIDGPLPLGTGGALRAALDKLGPAFLVTYGDSWLDTPYGPIVERFRATGLPALMTVFRNDGQWDRSNVWFEDGRIRNYDKKTRLPQMRHIDWGLGMLTAAAVGGARPPGEAFDLAELYGALANAGGLAGYEVGTRFYEIGSLEGLRETDALLRARAHNA
jgi:NDP-sugar pyrophosphorylase family protein